MAEHWFPGEWVEMPFYHGIGYLPPGYYDNGIDPSDKITTKIDRQELNQLIDFLFKNGYIKPQLGENRTEDVKIIHRLIDVMEKKKDEG